MTYDLQTLIKEYLSLICQDHHKDRDCHFRIEKVYSYGELKGYRASHDGYVNSTISPFFPTAAQAEQYLAERLVHWIQGEKEWRASEESENNFW